MSKSEIIHSGLKRLFAWVPEELHRRAKSAAAAQGIDFQDYIQASVREKLEREVEDRKASERRESFEVTR